jgi:hypothetical protein
MFGHIGHRRILVAAFAGAILAALGLTATMAVAAPPEHGTFTAHDQFVDTASCGFPIVGDYTFTNENETYFNAAGDITRVELHETTVGTLSANGVTLHESDRENVLVDFVDGTPMFSKHTGTLFHMIGPDGAVFLVAGQLVFEVVNGFDGPLIAAHGVDFGGDLSTFCAAFE